MADLRQFSFGRLLHLLVAALHGVIVAAVLIVPCYALVEALASLVRPSESENLTELIDLGRWLVLLGNSVVVCGVAVVTAVVLGLVFGVLAARTNLPGRAFVMAGAVLGACVPVYVYVVVFFSFVSVSRFTGSALACGLMHGLILAPLAIVVLAGAARAGDRELEEQALLDAGPWSVFLRVTLAHLRWGIAVLGMIVILLVAMDYTIADILMVRTFAEEVYTQYALRRFRAGPLITSLPAFAVVAVLLVVAQRRFRFFGESSLWQFGTPPPLMPLGRLRWVAGSVCIAIVTAALGTPVVAVARKIGSLGGFASAIAGLQRELALSGALSIGGATVVVLFGVGLAWAALRSTRFRWPLCAVIVLLLAMPAPVIGISLIGLLNRPGVLGGIYDSPLVVTVGYVVRFLPLGVLLLIPAVQRVPLELELAARIDGADWFGRQRHVFWPAALQDASIVWLVLLVLCFAEVGCTVLVAPPGWSTASVRAFTLMHFGVYRDLAVLAAASVGCIVLPWLLLLRLLKGRLSPGRARRRSGGTAGSLVAETLA